MRSAYRWARTKEEGDTSFFIFFSFFSFLFFILPYLSFNIHAGIW